MDASPAPGQLVLATVDMDDDAVGARMFPWEIPAGGDVATLDIV